jgi:hypothetical protein
MGLNTLRMIRSTLLSETVAARLNPGISAWREHQKYNRDAARRSRRRVLRSITRRLCGPTDTDYQRIEQLKGICNRTIYLYQRWLDNPLYRYVLLVKKIYYMISLIVKTIFNFLMLATVGLIIYIGFDFYKSDAASVSDYMRTPFVKKNFEALFALNVPANAVATSPLEYMPVRLFILFLLIYIFLMMRRMLRRLWDKDINRRNTSGLS